MTQNDLSPAEQKLAAAQQWWQTSIVDIRPGVIDYNGYPIEQLIGQIGFVDMVWLMLKGELPSAWQAKLLEAAMVAAVDHGPQAPSISIARMAATCGVGINNAMASGINALGDVHGGAGQQCLQMYNRLIAEGGLGQPDQISQSLRAILAENPRISGFGHRFHPVDPRSGPLLGLIEQAVAAGAVAGHHLQVARQVEAALQDIKGKLIPMNIDGATAAIYGELGFDGEEARGLFILSRSVGILSHAREQMRLGGRIKGPMPTSIPYTYTGKARRDLEK